MSTTEALLDLAAAMVDLMSCLAVDAICSEVSPVEPTYFWTWALYSSSFWARYWVISESASDAACFNLVSLSLRACSTRVFAICSASNRVWIVSAGFSPAIVNVFWQIGAWSKLEVSVVDRCDYRSHARDIRWGTQRRGRRNGVESHGCMGLALGACCLISVMFSIFLFYNYRYCPLLQRAILQSCNVFEHYYWSAWDSILRRWSVARFL